MSQLSTVSKHGHTDPSRDELVQLVVTTCGPTSNNLTLRTKHTGQQDYYPLVGDDQGGTSSLARGMTGCEVDDTYLDQNDEASRGDGDRLDFSQCKVPDREEHIESLHKIYNFVS